MQEVVQGGSKMNESKDKELSLDELVDLTKGFIRLADELYGAGKLSKDEYDELTYIKKDFLVRAEKEKKREFQQYL